MLNFLLGWECVCHWTVTGRLHDGGASACSAFLRCCQHKRLRLQLSVEEAAPGPGRWHGPSSPWPVGLHAACCSPALLVSLTRPRPPRRFPPCGKGSSASFTLLRLLGWLPQTRRACVQMYLERGQPLCPGRTCGLRVFALALFQAVSHTACWRLALLDDNAQPSSPLVGLSLVGWGDTSNHVDTPGEAAVQRSALFSHKRHEED